MADIPASPSTDRVTAVRSRWIPILIFVFALICRLVDFNATSITYDEQVGKDSGPWWKLIKKADFSSPDWGYAKPQAVIMRWFYGVLPEALFGDNPSSPYELGGARLIGAILSSGLVVVVFFFGRQVGGQTTGLLASLIFSLFPAILGHDRFASHDCPARLASLLSIWQLAAFIQTGRRQSWLWAAIWAGVSFAAYLRIGILTILITQASLVIVWLARRGWQKPESILHLIAFGLLSAVAGYLVFTLTWPYAWIRPVQAFEEVFRSPLKISQAGPRMEWFFGSIQRVPFSYYTAVYVAMMPLGVLITHLIGFLKTWREARTGREAVLLWALVIIPIGLSSFSFRSALNHYLLICYPATCVLAAVGIRTCAEFLERRLGRLRTWLVAAALLVIGSEAVIAVRVHPYHLEFFNSLVGGTRGVARNHTFMVGWYGEAINPLFRYVNRNAPLNSIISCHLGPWPGLADLRRNLRQDLKAQGFDGVHPLGADYVLRVGFETGGEFYRWQPNPEIYRKAMDLLVMGGSIGDVWERRITPSSSDLIYADDFSSPQIGNYVEGLGNMALNIFSDGKLFPVNSQRTAGMLMRLPSALLGKNTQIQIQSDVRILGGVAQIQCGSSSTNRTVVASTRFFEGRLESPRIKRPGTGDLWISIEMVTTNSWNQDPRTFWDYDWFDSLYVRAWPK
jgi:hypothetical protein